MNTPSFAWEEINVLETAIDDMNPEFYAYIIEKLLSEGARDAYLQPIIMKKGRPGVLLKVLVHRQNLNQILDIIFTETSTLGVRVRTENRAFLFRDFITVHTQYGPVRVKTACTGDGKKPLRYSPEYEDCKRLAIEKKVPLQDVYTAALVLAKSRNKVKNNGES
ncbi:nickel pincer cofactor biosynthesis protein LarC2 [Desulfotruncus alcoholivorax]|uniref:nickel insertion protein n=1 Tax=Desulfotruncus alcoholivorax TaxID=265477 RepID=UPI000414A38D|nr:nickel insertion protein [Desulfotruncus alcoholivorax]